MVKLGLTMSRAKAQLISNPMSKSLLQKPAPKFIVFLDTFGRCRDVDVQMFHLFSDLYSESTSISLSLSLWTESGCISLVSRTIVGELNMPTPQDQRELDSYDEFHKIFWVFIALWGTVLQTTYQPFETHYPKAVAFVVTIVIYFSSLLAELVLQTDGRYLVNTLSLLSGGLAAILPILIVVPAIGWLALGIWVCVSGFFVYRRYDKIRMDFRSVMNKLRNDNANESRDEQNGNANESRDEQNVNANESRDETLQLPV